MDNERRLDARIPNLYKEEQITTYETLIFYAEKRIHKGLKGTIQVHPYNDSVSTKTTFDHITEAAMLNFRSEQKNLIEKIQVYIWLKMICFTYISTSNLSSVA